MGESLLRPGIAGIAAIMVCVLMPFSTTIAQVALDSVPELRGIDVVEHLGDTIPLDLAFTDDHGNPVTLRQYFGHGQPVLLNLAYSNCPMLCTVVLNGVTNGVRELSLRPGTDFQMVTVSIDPLESADVARARKHRYVESVGEMGSDDGWAFLVGEENQSRRLADALGFVYHYDEDMKQYAHPAVTFLLTEDGVISRYLYGLEYKERDLRLGLLEASEGKIGTTIDRIILYCFHYDPDRKGYVAFAGNIMRLGGVITVVVLGIFLGVFWTRERLRRHYPIPNSFEGRAS
jgi:protein SCO1/2